jgi:uncharacterized protein (TIGR03067 family)
MVTICTRLSLGMVFFVNLWLVAGVVGSKAAQTTPPATYSAEEQQAAAELTRLGAIVAPLKDSGGLLVDTINIEVTDEVWKQIGVLKDRLHRLQGLGEKTHFTDTQVARLRPLANLRVVDINHARISDQGLAGLASLQHLEELYLRGTPITGSGLKELSGLPSLRTLFLCESAMGDEAADALAELKSIQSLNLDRTRITDAGLRGVGNLRHLTTLGLSGTAVSDAGLVHLRELQQLIALDLEATAITDKGAAALTELKALKSINVLGTRLTAAGVAKLKAELPQLILRGSPSTPSGGDLTAWDWFASPDVGFRILLPQGTEVATREKKTADRGSSWHFETQWQDHTFLIDTTPSALDVMTDIAVTKTLLARISQAQVQAAGGKLESIKDVWIGPYYGCRYQHTAPEKKATYDRLVMHGPGAIVELAIRSPVESPIAPTMAEHFLKSILITRPPATQSASPTTPQKPDDRPTARAGNDLARLQGTWEAVRFVQNGKPDTTLKHTFAIEKEMLTHQIYQDGKLTDTLMFRLQLNDTSSPKRIDYFTKSGPAIVHGIYALEGDSLKLCNVPAMLPRPEEFASVAGGQQQLLELRRLELVHRPSTPAATGKGALQASLEPLTWTDFQKSGFETPRGVRLEYAPEWGAAYQAGLRNGDLLLEMDHKPITTIASLIQDIGNCPAASDVSLLTMRNGQQQNIQVKLGRRISNEESLQRSLAEAQRGAPAAQWFVGTLYELGVGTKQNEITAAYWFQQAAEQEHAGAQSRLATLYIQGRGVARNDAEALRWLRVAAQQGDRVAQTNLGAFYAKGRGVQQSYQEAIRWYVQAATLGEPQAQANLASICYEGLGVRKDVTKAAGWAKLAAAQDHPEGLSMLGWMYHRGEGIPRNSERGLPMIRRAAELGSAQAQRNLGLIYHSGDGVPKDYRESIPWFRRAADQGDLMAMHNLGLAYYQGQGVPASREQAVAWFRKAAAGGLAESQHNLRVLGESR